MSQNMQGYDEGSRGLYAGATVVSVGGEPDYAGHDTRYDTPFEDDEYRTEYQNNPELYVSVQDPHLPQQAVYAPTPQHIPTYPVELTQNMHRNIDYYEGVDEADADMSGTSTVVLVEGEGKSEPIYNIEAHDQDNHLNSLREPHVPTQVVGAHSSATQTSSFIEEGTEQEVTQNERDIIITAPSAQIHAPQIQMTQSESEVQQSHIAFNPQSTEEAPQATAQTQFNYASVMSELTSKTTDRRSVTVEAESVHVTHTTPQVELEVARGPTTPPAPPPLPPVVSTHGHIASPLVNASVTQPHAEVEIPAPIVAVTPVASVKAAAPPPPSLDSSVAAQTSSFEVQSRSVEVEAPSVKVATPAVAVEPPVQVETPLFEVQSPSVATHTPAVDEAPLVQVSLPSVEAAAPSVQVAAPSVDVTSHSAGTELSAVAPVVEAPPVVAPIAVSTPPTPAVANSHPFAPAAPAAPAPSVGRDQHSSAGSFTMRAAQVTAV